MRDRDSSRRAVCFTFWFQGHNNSRYAALFPRLTSVVCFHTVVLSRNRAVRALQYRLWRALCRRFIYPMASRYLGRRYTTLLTVDPRQIASWKKSVIADIDDPTYNQAEVDLLNLSQVKAIIVTTERVKRTLQELGVTRPIHVIPQGVPMHIDAHRAHGIRARFKGDSHLVVGYLAPTLTLSCDGPRRARRGMDDLDLLFSAVEAARREEPSLTIWLLGQPSASVSRYAKERPWVKLFGYLPLSRVLDYVSNFDIGVYPRTVLLPPGLFSIKLAQYMACGCPIVSTTVDEALMVREAGCGIICDSQEEFSRALVSLARSSETRAELGMSGREYARSHLDWLRIIPRYEEIIRDVLTSEA